MIIFISGSINSGKSTVAKLLSERLPNSALIEIDAMRQFIAWMPIEQAIPINLENAVSVIRNFVNNKIHAVVPYPLSRTDYDFVLTKLDGIKEKIYTFILNPSLEITLMDRGSRKLTDWERERIEYHYSAGINNPGFGVTIDTTNQKPEETVTYILNAISGV